MDREIATTQTAARIIQQIGHYAKAKSSVVQTKTIRLIREPKPEMLFELQLIASRNGQFF